VDHALVGRPAVHPRVPAERYRAVRPALPRSGADRAIWGTDWPHFGYAKAMLNDGDLLELLYAYAPEPALRKAVLVDNPARLMGFAA